MTKLDGYECEGQLNLEEYLNSKEPEKPIEYGDRGCRVCQWWNHDNVEGCFWNDPYYLKDKFHERQIYPDCKFMPDDLKGLPMCANCEYANNFVHQDKPEYQNNHRDSHRKSMYDPLEEPNIYCTHRQGSLNRRTAYKDLEQKNFGVGHWHRQHEWDICDRWEKERDRWGNTNQ